MKDTVTLKELMAIAVRRGRLMVILAVVFAVLLGGVQGVRQVQASRNEENSPEKIEARYQEALAQYELDRQALEQQIASAQRDLDSQRDYNDQSLLMALDPYELYTTTIHLAVTNVIRPEQSQTILTESSMDFLVSKIQSQYQVYWDSLDLETALAENPYPGTADKYLREIVKLSLMNGGGLTITAQSNSQESASALAESALECLRAGQPTIAQGSYGHTFTLIARVTKEVIDDSLAETQAANLAAVGTDEATLTDLTQQLEALQEPQPEAGYTVSAILKGMVRWAILGAVLGIVLGIFAALVAYLFRSRAETTRQLALGLAVPFLGAVPRSRTLWDRMADRILGERTWKDQEQALAYLAGSARSALERGTAVALVSTLPLPEDDPALQAVARTLRDLGVGVSIATDAGHSPCVSQIVTDSAAVVLAERCGVSRWEDLAETMDQIKRLERPVAGVVTL